MQITVELPDDLARHPDPAREALEPLALEGYRSRQLTEGDVRQLLGFGTRTEVRAFLKHQHAFLPYQGVPGAPSVPKRIEIPSLAT